MLKGKVAVRELEKRMPSAGSGACECGQLAGQCSRSHEKATHTEEVGNLVGNHGNRNQGYSLLNFQYRVNFPNWPFSACLVVPSIVFKCLYLRQTGCCFLYSCYPKLGHYYSLAVTL